MSVKIPDAEFKLLPPDVSTGGFSVLMVGSTRCGKTTCLKHILDTYFPKHIGVIFSESAKAPAYDEMRKYSQLPLSAAFIPELIRDSFHANKELKNHYPWLYVLDDCPLVKNDKQITKLTTIYRNSNISAVVCIQSPTMLTPTQRSNFNFVFLFKQNTAAQVEAVVKGFLRGYFPDGWTFEQRIHWYQNMTQDHHFIFLDNLNGTIQRCKLTPQQIGKR